MFQKLMFSLGFLFLLTGFSFGLANSAGDETIVLPNIDLSIEDESEVPLKNQDQKLSEDQAPDLTHIDIEELANSRVSEKIKSELENERDDEQFSLSGLRLYYGTYGNLTADINLGKSIGRFNYLVTYLRNKRESTGFNGINYFNTEMSVDDLSVDLIWSLGDQLDLHSTLGYYGRVTGLYTNEINLSANLVHFPLELGLLYRPDMNSQLSLEMNGQILSTSFKQTNNYVKRFFWNAGVHTAYQVNWSRHNFLKADLKYLYGQFISSNLNEVKISVVDQFPVLSFLALEIGAGGALSTDDDFFWYPHLFAIIYPFKELNIKAGMTGLRHRFSIEDRINQNQTFFDLVLPERGWLGRVQVAYSPLNHLTFRVASEYDSFKRYLNRNYHSDNGIYQVEPLSNVTLLRVTPSLETMIADWLVLTLSYTYTSSPQWENLLFVHHHLFFADLVMKYNPWGSEWDTRLSWQDETQDRAGSVRGSELVWNFNYIQKINRQFYFELRLSNLLNQEVFEENQLPKGGFNLYGGLKILL